MLLIGKGTVFTRDAAAPLIKDGGVLTEEGKILSIGKFEDLKKAYPRAQVVDAGGQLIMPAFINCHHHIYSAFARGLQLSGYAPKNFMEILEGMWWRMDRVLDVEDSRLSAAATYMSCIENGVATVFDHHASYGEVQGSLFAIAREAENFGVRSCLCYEISDRNGRERLEEAIAENIAFADHAKKNPRRLAGLIGLHASFTLRDESLAAVAERNTSGYGYHIHVAEDLIDENRCIKEHGMRVVERLKRFGIVNDRSIAGHCVHINDEERRILKEADMMVVQNPQSNMGNAIGAQDAMALLSEGILLGLGTDGFTSDMLESVKVANLLIKHSKKDATVGFTEACRLLFENNPEMTKRTFGVETGVLREGAAADVIVMEYDAITPLDENNLNGHLLFGMNGRNVVTTVTDGVLRMYRRELLGQG